jgi:hypothetical protein
MPWWDSIGAISFNQPGVKQNILERDQEVNMFTHTRHAISRMDIVDSLAHLRQEWQETVDGESLIDVQASVGLMLGDMVMMLGLSSDEQKAVLGEDLRREFIQVVRYRDNGNE